MPPSASTPHCLLESWDPQAKAWITDPTPHESVAAAVRAATERSVYRVVLVANGHMLEVETFAIA